MEYPYTVDKTTVESFRQALATYLLSINRRQDTYKIMSGFYDMDQYPGDRMPLDIVNREFDLAASFFQDEYIGLKVINHIDIKNLNLYKGLKLVLTPFFEKGMEVPLSVICHLICRYSRLLTDSLVIEVSKIEGGLGLEFKPLLLTSICKHHIDTIIFTVHKIINFFTQKYPDKVFLSHRVTDYGLYMYRHYFSAPAELTTDSIYLRYWSKKSSEYSYFLEINDEFKSFSSSCFFIGPLHNIFHEQFPNYSYSEQCQHILITIIGMVRPTRKEVAQILNMSVSRLQRCLKEEDTTFQEVLLNTRKELAHKYLVDHDLSGTHVAFLLGYQSSSQFFTAFKDWFSITPKSYKKMHS